MPDKPLQLVGNRLTEVPATTVSAGASSAGKIPALDNTGRLDTTMMPVGIGADTKVLPASETLAAGDYVNIHDALGTASVRKADASAAASGKRAHGFVLDNVSNGQQATVYFTGTNTAKTGLVVGSTYALSATTPGGTVVLTSAPTTAGHILQTVGVATGTAELETMLGTPVVRG